MFKDSLILQCELKIKYLITFSNGTHNVLGIILKLCCSSLPMISHLHLNLYLIDFCCFSGSGIHIQDENKITDMSTRMSCNKGRPGWRSRNFNCHRKMRVYWLGTEILRCNRQFVDSSKSCRKSSCYERKSLHAASNLTYPFWEDMAAYL